MKLALFTSLLFSQLAVFAQAKPEVANATKAVGCSILSVRFKISEVDEMAAKTASRAKQ